MFELGKWLVRGGATVTYFTRSNSEQKPEYEDLGPNCRIHRIVHGPREDIDPELLTPYLDEFSTSANDLLCQGGGFEVVHSQYWLSGAVAERLRFRKDFLSIYHPLSFGRVKQANIGSKSKYSEIRDKIETHVLNSCDCIIVGTPEEKEQVQMYYREVDYGKCQLLPHWVDGDIFCPRPEPPGAYFRRQIRNIRQGS